MSFLAVMGLVSSLAHYHSESLECLNHADEQHYTQNNNLCPVCTIVVDNTTPVENDFQGIFTFEQLVEEFQQIILTPVSYYLEPGRAPPTLV
jgi:hypothetical protein